MRLLVCGGRNFDQNSYLFRQLNKLNGVYHFTDVIHGGARGADTMAGDWARSVHLRATVFKADWDRLGNRAGPIRNQQMIDEGKPQVVAAFPGGIGTADMIRRAKAAGLLVIEFPGNKDHKVRRA